MGKEFKVGERVAVYRGGERHIHTIAEIDSAGTIHFNFNGYWDRVHPKQCRKLVKQERREWKIGNLPLMSPISAQSVPPSGFLIHVEGPQIDSCEIVHVREVRPRKEKP
jgi:hypothetical protein